MYINGEWLEDADYDKLDVHNPSNGERIGYIPLGGKKEAELAAEAAYAAFPSWSQTTAEERSKLLRKWYDLILAHAEQIARLITLEMGKPLREARGEVRYAASFVEWYAEEAKRIYGETVPASFRNKRIAVLKQPVGVVAAITPWNFPAAMLTRKLAPAFAAGCTAIVKPSELTPFTAVKLVQLAEEAGFPPGTINLVMGDAPAIGASFMENEKVRKISFTGSTRIGKLLMEQGAKHIKKLSLELGGHAPMLVMDDADIDKAVQQIIASKFRNAGQACICGNRVYVQSTIYDRFITKFVDETEKLKVGDGFDEQSDIGPLINKAALDKVELQVKDALQKGAKLLTGGESITDGGGYFYKPTILGDARENMQCMTEETFGPVAPVQVFDTDEEAIRLANHTSYGLAAYVFSESMSRGLNIVEKLEYGIVGWNDGLPSTAQAPFGGMKESGIGREGGHQGLECYLETKYVSIGI